MHSREQSEALRAAASAAFSNGHTCHWPGCTAEVEPKLWGCMRHWRRLPKRLRDRIWQTYRPGQEVDKRPSTAYMLAAAEVQQWIATNG